MELAAFEKCCVDIAVNRSGKKNVAPDEAVKQQETAEKVKSSACLRNLAGAPEDRDKKPVSEPCNDDMKLLMVLHQIANGITPKISTLN